MVENLSHTQSGEITGVNRHLGCAVVDHKTYVWITKWLDEDGEDCTPDEAVSCVAGEDGVGWWSIDLSHYSRVNVN